MKVRNDDLTVEEHDARGLESQYVERDLVGVLRDFESIWEHDREARDASATLGESS